MSEQISAEVAAAHVRSSSPGQDIEKPQGKDDHRGQEPRAELARELEARVTSLDLIVSSFAIAGAFRV